MKKQTFLEFLILLCILYIAADLRLSNIANTPGWYNDEGTIIEIADNLAQGKFEYLGLKDSILIAARQPLFPCLLALLFKIFGAGIITLRAFTGALGVLNTLLIYLVLRKEDKVLALVCSLCFAILPEAILFSRVGFSYNLVATLVLLALWVSFRYLEKGSGKYIYLTALILGLGFLSEIAAIAFLPVLLLLALWKNWKHVFLAALLYFVPFGIYSVVMLALSPQAYLYDIHFIFFRVSSLSVLLKGILFTMNMARIGDFLLIFAGLLGIIFWQGARVQKLVGLYLFLPFLVIGTSTGITWLGEYQLIPLFPFIGIGLGCVLLLTLRKMHEFCQRIASSIQTRYAAVTRGKGKKAVFWIVEILMFLALIIVPVVGHVIITQLKIRDNEYVTSMDDYMLNTNEARQVVNYLNGNASPDDLVLASPALAWAIDKNTTDYLISLADDGKKTDFFPEGIPAERLAFPVEYTNAEYIVIDNIWRNWGEEFAPDLIEIREFAETGSIVFQTEHIAVYKTIH